MKSTPELAMDWFAEHGHIVSSGRCEKCWSTAASMYANGQGAYDSKTDAYYVAMERAEDEALKATKEIGR